MSSECIVYFDGYLAELIRLVAEKKNKSVEEYVLSLFEKRCNAPLKNKRMPTHA